MERSLKDLQLTNRVPDLRAHIEQVLQNHQAAHLNDVEWRMSSGTQVVLEVQVTPLVDTHEVFLGASVSFVDISPYKRLQEELQLANQEVETAYEELQSSNEELETTNEELQSTVEELETTNEELQSTNEELETINEELQSTNEELNAVNEEVRVRTEEVNQANAFLESILTGIRAAVVVVDRNFQVEIWSRKAENLWGLRLDEVQGKNFLSLDIGLPVEQLKQPIRAGLAKEFEYHEVMLDAINRRGKPIRCKVTISPQPGADSVVRGVIILMEDEMAAE
jgi:two-component system, chemotaxis family, CheB/CheR fusion protein